MIKGEGTVCSKVMRKSEDEDEKLTFSIWIFEKCMRRGLGV
jgi:hypothetical protein